MGKKSVDISKGIPEAQVLREVAQVLSLTDVRLQRMNAGGFVVGDRYIRGAKAGTLDFEGYDRRGRFVGIECKRPKGGRLSPAQKERIDDINECGGIAFVARSAEEALRLLREGGCI